MKIVCWELNNEDTKHIIKLKHNAFSGKSSLYCDDKFIMKKRALLGDEVKLSFNVEDKQCNLDIVPNKLAYEYNLTVNEYGALNILREEKSKIEWWAWLFAAACLIIPIVFIESLILAIIGIGGAVKCLSIAAKGNKERKNKIALCAKTTALSWVYLGIFYLVVNHITEYFLKIYT